MKLNCDLGEIAAPVNGKSIEEYVMPLIDQASIACGGHAGDRDSMRRCVELAVSHDVSIGAHPSYPDREHFGRRSLQMPTAALADAIAEQTNTLQQVCEEFDTRLDYVKPHGALYNDMSSNAALCSTLLQAIAFLPANVALMHFAGLQLPATERSLIAEAFADRRYTDAGTLQPRSEPGAVLSKNEMLAQAQSLSKTKSVISVSGKTLAVSASSLCVHGDNPSARDSIAMLRQIVNHD